MVDRLHSLESAGERLGGVCESTVRELIRTGALGHTRVRRRVMVSESAIERFIAANTVTAKDRSTRKRQGKESTRQDAPQKQAGTHRLLDIRALCS